MIKYINLNPKKDVDDIWWTTVDTYIEEIVCFSNDNILIKPTTFRYKIRDYVSGFVNL